MTPPCDTLSDAVTETPKVRPYIDWINEFCHHHYGVEDDWRWFEWKREEYGKPHEFLLVRGAVCTTKYAKGKHKGADNWKKRDRSTERMFSIPLTALEQFELDWQKRTGKCRRCCGGGETWAGWSANDGNRYTPCKACGATGKAPAP